MPSKRGRKNAKQSKSASSGRGREGGGGGAKKARKASPSDQARKQVLSTSDLAERILNYICIEDLAAVITTNKAFQEMASGNNVWRAYAQDRWPTITPMLQKLTTKHASLSSQGDHGGGRSIKQYVRTRLTKSQPSDWVEKERKEKRRKEEKERLRKGFEGYFFEIEVRNQLNDRIVISSHIPVDDEKQVWALFNKELGLRLRVQDPAFTISHLKRCTTTVTLIDLKGLRTVQLLELTDGFNNAGESLELASFEFDIHVHVNAVDEEEEEKEGEGGNERRRGGKQQRQPKMELEMYLGIGKAFGNTLRLKDSFELWKCLDACFGWIYWVDHEEDEDEGSSNEEGEEGEEGEGEFDDDSDEEYYDEDDFGGPPGIIEELLWGGGSDDGYDEESDMDDSDSDNEEEQGNAEA